MQARRAAREFALMILFQLEQAKGQLPSEAPSPQRLDEMIRASVRLLVEWAKDNLETAADWFQQTSYAIADYEFEHPDNLNAPLGTPTKAVKIATTKETREQLEKCLQGIELLWETLKTPHLYEYSRQPGVKEYTTQLVQLVCSNSIPLDNLINHYSEEWRVERLVKMDRLLVKMGMAEILWVDNLDTSVAINESVEIAKVFSLPESYKFINGLLGKLAMNIQAGELPSEVLQQPKVAGVALA
jgi:transcription antitermination protein NusB